MLFRSSLLPVAAMLSAASAAPAAGAKRDLDAQVLADPNYGPVPGQSDQYSNYSGVAAPFPAMYTDAIMPTTDGPAGADDLLFQNLLAAEWTIFNFYQTAVELFNSSDFTAYGLPNTTYERIVQIRDNEAGHARIFQNAISSNSIKPGQCQYQFGLSDPIDFLATETLLEISSMAFLTGLAIQATLPNSKATLVAIAETESRHNTWALIDVWNANPFAGPADTIFPYANQVLDSTRGFIVPGSCPSANPQFPTPSQNLPLFTASLDTTSVAPGAEVRLNFSNPLAQPAYTDCDEYYAVFFHATGNITVPFDITTNKTTIPAAFDDLGVIVAVVADTPGAPTAESVIAGPGIILEQVPELALVLAQ